ncbi:hypothetical protein ACJX0J_029690, partial [Zea mays]
LSLRCNFSRLVQRGNSTTSRVTHMFLLLISTTQYNSKACFRQYAFKYLKQHEINFYKCLSVTASKLVRVDSGPIVF